MPAFKAGRRAHGRGAMIDPGRSTLVAIVIALGSPAFAQTPARHHSPGTRVHDIIIANQSPLGIVELHVSPEGSSEWGADRLDGRRIAPGRSLHIPLGRERACTWDVAATYDDDSTEEIRGVDICHGQTAALDGANATPSPAEPRGEPHSVVLVNRSTRPISQVFVSPTAAQGWGENQLAADSVAPGTGITVTYRGTCAADIRVVFDNAAAEERPGIDVCVHPSIAIKPGWTTGEDYDAPDVITAPRTSRRT